LLAWDNPPVAKNRVDEAEQDRLEPGATSLLPSPPTSLQMRSKMMQNYIRLWREEDGQDIAEYAVMLAVILAIVVATVQLIGKSANNVFSSVASTIQ
jgi:Flp pilus assembly pilin Flp